MFAMPHLKMGRTLAANVTRLWTVVRLAPVVAMFAAFGPVGWMPTPIAYACSCVRESPTLQERVDRARAVFTGRVSSVERATVLEPAPGRGAPPSRIEQVRAQVEVLDAWKGISAGVVEVWTGTGGGDCGYRFSAGRDHLIFAHGGADGSLTTGSCSGNELLTDTATSTTLLQLGPGTGRPPAVASSRAPARPTAPPFPAPAAPPSPWSAVTVAAVLALGALGMLWIVRVGDSRLSR
jgi:hypothetical protein